MLSIAAIFHEEPSSEGASAPQVGVESFTFDSDIVQLAATFSAPVRGGPLELVDCAIKRLFDIAIAGSLLVALSPLILAISILVLLDGSTPFFCHNRLGQHLRSFSCWKFRSMMPGAEQVLEEYLSYNAEDAQLWARERKLAFDPRITTVGRVLRKTSLDELPQLFNVLRGDMSLVGPRPVTRDELAYYGASIGCYASVKPGITGLWQVSGRSEIGYEARVVLDRCYANVHNVVMDLAILLRTPGAVLSRRGAR